MSRYSPRTRRTARYKSWGRAVVRWQARPFKFNKEGERVEVPYPAFCHTCYYRVCRCDKLVGGLKL